LRKSKNRGKMDKHRLNICIIEPSDVVYEGMVCLLNRAGSHYFIFRISDIDELPALCKHGKQDVVIVNPVLIQNRLHDFLKFKKNFGGISWIALIYTFFNNEITGKFDDSFTVTDSQESIVGKINRSAEKLNDKTVRQEELSERETDVLILLVKGLSNKEIADKLNISIHTVISHRKNIIEKTGIKSLPGLTIFAISKKLIPLDQE